MIRRPITRWRYLSLNEALPILALGWYLVNSGHVEVVRMTSVNIDASATVPYWRSY